MSVSIEAKQQIFSALDSLLKIINKPIIQSRLCITIYNNRRYMYSTKRKTANMVAVERFNSSSLLSCISPVHLDQPSLH